MPLSNSDEIKTITIEGRVQGDTTTAQIDAEEDREIVGYSMGLQNIPLGVTSEGRLDLYLGTDPDLPGATPPDGTAVDLGGKFFDRGYWQWDNTNQLALFDFPEQMRGDSLPGWDWNEDVTLSFDFTESQGNGVATGTCQVYYREV